MNTFFYILGLQPGATAEEIKKAWRAKCLEHHPDRNGNPQEFIKVMHAYRMLTDSGYLLKHKPMESLDFEVQLAISFEEGFFGISRTINYNRMFLDREGVPVCQENIEPISITLNIPPRSCFGGSHKEPGAGMRQGSGVGDCFIRILVNPHNRYEIRGKEHITSTEQIPLDLMIKGGRWEVLTLFGLKTIWVPAGSRPKTEIQISGCGYSENGCHIAVLEPIFPTLDDLKKDAWKGLDIHWADVQTENKQDEDLIKKHDEMITPPS